MALPLAEAQAAGEIAQLLYDFLPGSAHAYADQLISFPGVAQSVGVGAFWRPGSKLPALRTLLELTLENARDRFCALVYTIVRRGMTYRANKKNPVTRQEIEMLNKLILKVHFKIPDLWDPSFLGALPNAVKTDATATTTTPAIDLSQLAVDFSALIKLEPQPRGFAFEKFLESLFAAYDLAPRGSFRVVGEQIDGSFVLDSDTYLLEAKWHDSPIGSSDLISFHGRVEARARWARGVFISYSGYSADGLTAFARGRSPSIIGLDGLDLHQMLHRSIPFPDVLHAKLRRAAETGDFFTPVGDLSV